MSWIPKTLAVLFALAVVYVLYRSMASSDDTPRTKASSPSESVSPAAANTSIELSDGSQLSLYGVTDIAPWACGHRKKGTMAIPESSQSLEVTIYYDREWNLVSVVAPDGTKLHEVDPSRQCLKNWTTGEMEMLTEAEYKAAEK